jgi:hypothetical protein
MYHLLGSASIELNSGQYKQDLEVAGAMGGVDSDVVHVLNAESMDSDTEDNERYNHFTCNGCGNYYQTGDKWFRCTDCGDFDICSKCDIKQFHHHHKQQMHKFVEPECLQVGCFCDSCGYQFKLGPTFRVYQCSVCEDYALCKKCAEQGMHAAHSQELTLVEIQSYLDDIS